MTENREYTESEVRNAINYSHHFYGDLIGKGEMSKGLLRRTIDDRKSVPLSLAEWIEERMGWEFDEENAKYRRV